MKFAHIADCHIGGWRDPKMKDLPLLSFVKAIDSSKEKNVDFVLISGDLFNTSHPQIDSLKIVVKKLKELKDAGIQVYMVAGSHDFSNTGKTIIDVLEEAGLIINVVRGEIIDNKLSLNFTIDKKTGAKITGMLGKKGSLEKKFYSELDRESLENEKGFKIFMFHTSITELKPKKLEKMESSPISFLPRGFDYYAGGHVHIVENKTIEGYKNVVYPGPTFPNSFSELEMLKSGGFYIYEDAKLFYEKIPLHETLSLNLNANNKTPETITTETISEINNHEIKDSIVLLRFEGKLKSGKPSDIDFSKIFKILYAKGAYYVMRSTTKIDTKEFEEIQIKEDSVEKIEEKLISEHSENNKTFENQDLLIKNLMKSLSQEKNEDEKTSDYEKKIITDLNKILNI